MASSCSAMRLCQKGWPSVRTSLCRHTQCTAFRRRGRGQLRCAASQHTPASAQRTPAARAAIFTGTYATIAGLALTAAPLTVFGLLFDSSAVPRGWIRVGGILFALIGMQYFGAGLNDSPLPPGAQPQESSDTTSETGSTNTKSLIQADHAPLVFSRSFYEASIWSRLFLVIGFTALVVMKELQEPLGLLVLAALNLVGALSMLRALRTTDALLAQRR